MGLLQLKWGFSPDSLLCDLLGSTFSYWDSSNWSQILVTSSLSHLWYLNGPEHFRVQHSASWSSGRLLIASSKKVREKEKRTRNGDQMREDSLSFSRCQWVWMWPPPTQPCSGNGVCLQVGVTVLLGEALSGVNCQPLVQAGFYQQLCDHGRFLDLSLPLIFPL